MSEQSPPTEQEYKERLAVISQVAFDTVRFFEDELQRRGLGTQDLGAAKSMVRFHLVNWQFWKILFTPYELVHDLMLQDQSAPTE